MRVKVLVGTLAALAVCLFGLTGTGLAPPLSFEVKYDLAAGTTPVDGRIITPPSIAPTGSPSRASSPVE